MSFTLPKYKKPDLISSPLGDAPDCRRARVDKPGVAPEGFHATSIFPEYFKIGGRWLLPEGSRMDCVAVIRGDRVEVVEFRRLEPGDEVVLGRTEDGSEGILVHTDGFSGADGNRDTFSFRTGRSRETSYSRDYDSLYELLVHEREKGHIVWVLGPAVAFDSDARRAMCSLIRGGFVHAVMAGNALATHDLEAACFGTALGQDIYTQQPMSNGHYCHIDVINGVRDKGGIRAFMEGKGIRDGIVHTCMEKGIPMVLAGSIRDDGPLPGVLGNAYEAQDAMRVHTGKATTVICLASQLHSIAAGNMTPSYQVVDGVIRPVFIYSVDISEFVVNKLRDRGTLGVISLVTNVQDFLVHIEKSMAGR